MTDIRHLEAEVERLRRELTAEELGAEVAREQRDGARAEVKRLREALRRADGLLREGRASRAHNVVAEALDSGVSR